MIYNGYALPRLLAITKTPFLSVVFVSFFFALQNSFLMLVGVQFGYYTFLAFFPQSVVMVLVYMRLLSLPPLNVFHWLMDLPMFCTCSRLGERRISPEIHPKMTNNPMSILHSRKGFAELPTYFGYVMPRLEAQGLRKWLAITLPSLMLGLQHIGVPLLFDLRFILWRGLMYLPFALFVGIVLHWRPRLLPYMAIVHVLMDLSFAMMLLNVAY